MSVGLSVDCAFFGKSSVACHHNRYRFQKLKPGSVALENDVY